MDPVLLILFLHTLEACSNVETFERCFDLLIARGFRLIASSEEEKYENAVPEVDFSFVLYPVPEEGALYCQANPNQDYIRSNEAREFYPTMLEVFKDLYNSWHPFYGHQDYEGGVSLNRDTVIEDQDIDYLYRINLFGPELVSKLGRDRLLSAPAWRIEELADGGIFLIPQDHMAIGGGGHSLKKVADHLGMNTPQAPGEEWEEYEDEG